MKTIRMRWRALGLAAVALAATITAPARAESLVADGAVPEIVTKGYIFTEGPAADPDGNLYFTDVPGAKIFKLVPGGEATTFLTNSGGVNGLYFDASGMLIGCQGSARKLVAIDAQGAITVLAETFEGKKFNSPNDLWIDPKGGIYFTDPRYGNRPGIEMESEDLYYLKPDRKTVVRAASGFVRPNGVVGTPDGKMLYVADHADNKTYRFPIAEDGSLGERTLFAEQGADGMTIDERGNVYLTGDHIEIFSPEGKHLERIEMPVKPSNLRFAGPDRKTLYITARTRVYALPMKVSGP